MPKQPDFSGWATKTNILCTDGRTIMKDAFADDNGRTVPMVWEHCHDDPTNVLGHCVLENREEGVYTYGYFNDTPKGQAAKSAVQHGDIGSLSIYANQLRQRGGEVMHGIIREVSLVFAGANAGATIDNISLAHSDGTTEDLEDEAVIYNDDGTIYLEHADDRKEEEDVEDNRTVQDVFDSMNEDQKNVVYYMLGKALESKGEGGHEENEGEDDMKHSIFESNEPVKAQLSLSHSDQERIFTRARQMGSLRDAVQEFVDQSNELAHTVLDRNNNEVTYGIADIDYLFPDYQALNKEPDFIRRDNDWVYVFNNGVHKTPFPRVKTVHANITMDEARAKGYTKGARKVEEVFSLLKRSVDPQTVYKKQKFDRDDLADIDWDIIPWVKQEMKDQLQEELARASLIGDGRLPDDPDKISDEHIKPVVSDDDLYTIKIDVAPGTDDESSAKALIRAFLKNRRKYKGSGNIIAFMSEDWIDEMLLLEDGFGHALYEDEAKLAKKFRVSRIVGVPQLSGLTDENGKEIVGIFLDIKDYNWGAGKMGQTAMFDDFDIDYNQYKYLIETRMSGMLIKPYSAMVLKLTSGQAAGGNG